MIFFAFDGLTYEDLATARYYAARHQDGRVLTPERLLSRGSSGTLAAQPDMTEAEALRLAWREGPDGYAFAAD